MAISSSPDNGRLACHKNKRYWSVYSGCAQRLRRSEAAMPAYWAGNLYQSKIPVEDPRRGVLFQGLIQSSAKPCTWRLRREMASIWCESQG